MAPIFKKMALVAGATLAISTSAYAQQAAMQPEYQDYQTNNNVPTLNLPRQYDPTIGQVDGSQSTEIIRSNGDTTATDLTAAEVAPAAEPSREPKPGESVTGQPVVGRLPEQTGLGKSRESDGTGQPKYQKGMILTGKVHVADGHSLLVGDDAVRLNGVEAPGLKQLCFTVTGTSWKCGEAAQKRLRAVAEGKKAVCVVNAPAGSGAAVTCAVPGIADIARILIEEGFVTVNRFGPDGYRAIQSQARHDRAGIWVGTFTDPADWRKKNR